MPAKTTPRWWINNHPPTHRRRKPNQADVPTRVALGNDLATFAIPLGLGFHVTHACVTLDLGVTLRVWRMRTGCGVR